jgi:hypothetical protein
MKRTGRFDEESAEVGGEKEIPVQKQQVGFDVKKPEGDFSVAEAVEGQGHDGQQLTIIN